MAQARNMAARAQQPWMGVRGGHLSGCMAEMMQIRSQPYRLDGSDRIWRMGQRGWAATTGLKYPAWSSVEAVIDGVVARQTRDPGTMAGAEPRMTVCAESGTAVMGRMLEASKVREAVTGKSLLGGPGMAEMSSSMKVEEEAGICTEGMQIGMNEKGPVLAVITMTRAGTVVGLMNVGQELTILKTARTVAGLNARTQGTERMNQGTAEEHIWKGARTGSALISRLAAANALQLQVQARRRLDPAAVLDLVLARVEVGAAVIASLVCFCKGLMGEDDSQFGVLCI